MKLYLELPTMIVTGLNELHCSTFCRFFQLGKGAQFCIYFAKQLDLKDDYNLRCRECLENAKEIKC